MHPRKMHKPPTSSPPSITHVFNPPSAPPADNDQVVIVFPSRAHAQSMTLPIADCQWPIADWALGAGGYRVFRGAPSSLDFSWIALIYFHTGPIRGKSKGFHFGLRRNFVVH